MEEMYFIEYMRHNGKEACESFSNFSEANTRKNTLINEFGYSPMEIKLTCKFMKRQ